MQTFEDGVYPPELGRADMDGQAWWSHWLFQDHVDDQLMESSERGRGEDTQELKQPRARVSTLSRQRPALGQVPQAT